MNVLELKFASDLDILSALELKFPSLSKEDITNIFRLLNMGFIESSDTVLVLSSRPAYITWTISYFCLPKLLISNNLIPSHEEASNIALSYDDYKDLNELLYDYQYTNPVFTLSTIDNLNFKHSSFSIIIAENIEANEKHGMHHKSRFLLEAGPEYDMFVHFLKFASAALEDQGYLLMLVKPCWILKSWQMLKELELQIEYLDHHLYTNTDRTPNTPVWLRFQKCNTLFNDDKQKRNILALMKATNIDRLYAHRNNLTFPYVELINESVTNYVKVEQNLEYLQYFFTAETTTRLSNLCIGYTACLVTPSIAVYSCSHNKNVVLFERDNRFRQTSGLKFVKYDLETGLTLLNQRRYSKKFDTVICDPPFDINLDILARDILELINPCKTSTAYVIFPEKRKASLFNAMKSKGFYRVQEENNIDIEYGKPPKLVRLYGKKAIQLYKFQIDISSGITQHTIINMTILKK